MLSTLFKPFFKAKPKVVSPEDLEQAINTLITAYSIEMLEGLLLDPKASETVPQMFTIKGKSYWVSPSGSAIAQLLTNTPSLGEKPTTAILNWLMAITLPKPPEQQAVIQHCQADTVLQQQAQYRWELLKQLIEIHLHTQAQKVS